MKNLKVLFTIVYVLIFILSGCKSKTPQELLIEEFETYVTTDFIPKLNDPTSYEKIGSFITDTITQADRIQNQIDIINESSFNKEEYEKYKFQYDYSRGAIKKMYEGYMLEYKAKIVNDSIKVDSLTKILNSTPADKIEFIFIEHKYRAKNKFNALIIGKCTYQYFPDETEQSRKFVLYSND